MEETLLTYLQNIREGDETARTELNDLLRTNPQARQTMARLLVDEQALIGHLRDDRIVSILDDSEPAPRAPVKRTSIRPLGAAVAAGLALGVIGMSLALGYTRPKTMASALPINNGNFEAQAAGSIERGFPAEFGQWRGDPVEVVEEADGNQVLRFLETANVLGNPDGGAAACNVFQLVDLSSIQQQWDTKRSELEAQLTLELSARFHREAAPTDAELPNIKATCTIHLFQAEPESIGKAWPQVIREALAARTKHIRLAPGDEPAVISASCLLPPEANIALISVNVHTKTSTKTPIKLGGYFADDVRLTVIKQPNLPVRFVK